MKVFQKGKLSDLVQKDIMGKIKKNEYLPGNRLPTENQLCEIYDVGRYTIREALKGLESNKIIEIKKGIGTFVSSLEKGDYSKYPLETIFILQDSKDKIEKMLELRMIIEVQSAKLAATRISDKDLQKLSVVLKNMELLPKKGIDYFALQDTEFHQIIANATNNPYISKILELFSSQIRVDIKKLMFIPAVQNSVSKWHNELYNSLKKRDPDAAQKSMDNHLRRVLDYYKKNTNMSQ